MGIRSFEAVTVIDAPQTRPHLAQVYSLLRRRPAWREKEPLAIERELFQSAKQEMASVARMRGFPLPTAPDIEGPNFMLWGVPIVPKGDDHGV